MNQNNLYSVKFALITVDELSNDDSIEKTKKVQQSTIESQSFGLNVWNSNFNKNEIDWNPLKQGFKNECRLNHRKISRLIQKYKK